MRILLYWIKFAFVNYKVSHSEKLRHEYRYDPSDEVILEICDNLTGGRSNSNKNKTILVEYPDDFIRKMKLTGLFSIRGMGRFIDINKNESSKIDYILKKYNNISYPTEEKLYFNFVSTIDQNLIDLASTATAGKDAIHGLKKWQTVYNWSIVRKELLSLASPNSSSTDNILKYISRPLRLEFLVSLAIINQYPEYILNPNYIADDEGLPSSHAPGNNSDIECIKINDNSIILIEVTLLNGTAQYKHECFAVARHLDEYKNKYGYKHNFTIFIAPQIFKDTARYFKYSLDNECLDIRPIDIKTFVDNCDQNKYLE